MKAVISRKREAAFSLMEILVVVGIIGVMFVSLYGGISSGFAVVHLARENLRANQIMMEKMETIRLYTWDQINSDSFMPDTFTADFYPSIPDEAYQRIENYRFASYYNTSPTKSTTTDTATTYTTPTATTSTSTSQNNSRASREASGTSGGTTTAGTSTGTTSSTGSTGSSGTSSKSNESMKYAGTVVVTNADVSSGYTNLMRKIIVTVTWTNSGTVRSRQMETYVSRYGMQNYIY